MSLKDFVRDGEYFVFSQGDGSHLFPIAPKLPSSQHCHPEPTHCPHLKETVFVCHSFGLHLERCLDDQGGMG